MPPSETQKLFGLQFLDTEICTFDQLITFVQNQIKGLKISSIKSNLPTRSLSTSTRPGTMVKKALISTNASNLCPICNQGHSIYKCPQFFCLPLNEVIGSLF